MSQANDRALALYERALRTPMGSAELRAIRRSISEYAKLVDAREHGRIKGAVYREQHPEIGRAAAKRYIERHSDNVAARQREHRQIDRERVYGQTQDWRARNPGKMREINARWLVAHRDDVLAHRRSAYRARMQTDPEGFRAARRASYAANREAVRKYQQGYRRRQRESDGRIRGKVEVSEMTTSRHDPAGPLRAAAIGIIDKRTLGGADPGDGYWISLREMRYLEAALGDPLRVSDDERLWASSEPDDLDDAFRLGSLFLKMCRERPLERLLYTVTPISRELAAGRWDELRDAAVAGAMAGVTRALYGPDETRTVAQMVAPYLDGDAR